ncbi:PTS transporter subunit IIC [Companilactobacillus halodurans]|uniref:PTS glucitol transporter subunit IIA n=1 Tax=Companilactobacillus halodurans TaxID=2584183 RepID=A0A5P0ZVW7_9LACO|nr:PTS transporter subunit IIC [Companilactobacillus halodurans]MQS74831.1 PTS glucitol transporter subunit IIA [Companilactobacillus halodurans]MQS97226.1 PTS glucitol transporter subunit IIA [Companilactobacillus halodurans]
MNNFLMYGNGLALVCLVIAVVLTINKTSFTKVIESLTKFIISIMATSTLVVVLMRTYNNDIAKVIERTSLKLNIIDLGWTPAAIITWSSIYNLIVLSLMMVVNLTMLHYHYTETLDIDIFDMWHLSFVGLLTVYMGANIILSLIFVMGLGILKLKNSDLMKPTFDDLMNNQNSPMTSTHMNYLMNPIVFLLNEICSWTIPNIDKINFDSAKLNKIVGFWGSKFATGFFVGILIGIVGKITIKDTLGLAFLLGAFLELFNVIGSWLTSSLNPIIQVLSDKLNKKAGGQIRFIGLDWAFLSSRPEVWTVANILAPCLIIESFILPGNHILPLGGLIAMGITPSLLVVTRGKVLRMIVIGVVEIPIFLWSATLSAPFITSMFKNILLTSNTSIGLIGSATKEGPIEQILAIMIGKSSKGNVKYILITVISLVIYLLLFYWYQEQMKKRNTRYISKSS